MKRENLLVIVSPEIIGNLMENYIVDVKNKTTANNQVNSYYSNRQQLNT